MLQQTTDIFFIIVKVFAIFFAAVSVFGLIPTERPEKTQRRLKFAVLVPARNEENCIAGIVESIRAQDYPPELYDVFVIPNNCTDNTASAAFEAGAKIITVSPEVHSKGAALHETIERLLQDRRYDAFCVFDADNEADEGFLAAMNDTLCSGARVAKSRILSKNRHESWVCACYDIYFSIANLFMNRARENIGLSARLIGTGFAVKRDFLEEIGGWNTETITEDAEFFAMCAARGERIAFCERAITYDEEPLDFKTSLTQRKRWMSGVMHVAVIKAPELFRGLNRTASFTQCADTLAQFAFAYIQALIPFAFVLAFIASPIQFVLSIPVSAAIGYVTAAANAALSLALDKRFSVSMIPGILTYPVFLASFIPLQTVSLFSRTTKWQEIKHTGVRRREVCPQQLPRTAA